VARTEGSVQRKALEEDALTSAVNRAADYTATHRNLVLGVTLGLIAAVMLTVLWLRESRSKASVSGDTLSQVVLGYANGNFDQALELANTVQSQHPGTEAAVLAKYLAGACQLRLGRFQEAEQSLRGYLDVAAKAPFYERAARSALAATLTAQGRAGEAATIYQEEAAKLPEPLAATASLDAARALAAAGSYDQAKPILETLAKGTDATARQAKIELAVLESTRR
jgi:tetratricopeptide (TPR) repeat protein